MSNSGLCVNAANGFRFSSERSVVTKYSGSSATAMSADALRVVRVEIEGALDAVRLERRDRGVGIRAAAERREFHEQPPVE